MAEQQQQEKGFVEQSPEVEKADPDFTNRFHKAEYDSNLEDLAHLLGPNAVEFSQNLFQTLDADKSGALSRDELDLAFNAKIEEEEDKNLLVKLADKDKSGTIDIREFCVLMSMLADPMEIIRKNVEFFNDNATDGFMTTQKAKEVLEASYYKTADPQMYEQLETVIVNAYGGKVDFTLFETMWRSLILK